MKLPLPKTQLCIFFIYQLITTRRVIIIMIMTILGSRLLITRGLRSQSTHTLLHMLPSSKHIILPNQQQQTIVLYSPLPKAMSRISRLPRKR